MRNIYPIRPTRNERRLGRLLRDENGHPNPNAGITYGAPPAPAGQPANNSGGNGDPITTPVTTQDNNGQPPIDAGFWETPAPDPTKITLEKEQETQETQNNQQFGQQLMATIQGLSFGDIFTPDVAAKAAEGDYSSLNDAFQKLGQASVQHATVQSMQIMKRFGANLMTQVESMIQDRLGDRDSESTLLKEFPTAADPAVRPVIEKVFKQSLAHSNGDRTKAIQLTRDMLKIMGTKMSSDLNLDIPPSSRDDGMTDNAKSLVDELLGRN